MVKDTLFRTTDTALAAYLKSCGYDITDIDASGRRAIFLFQDTDGLKKHIQDFELMRGGAEQVVLFFHTYKTLVQKIHILKQIQE